MKINIYFYILISFTISTLNLVRAENLDSIAAKSQRFNFFKGQKTFIKNPFKLRDPFKRPMFRKKRKSGELIKEKNKYTNIGTIDGTELSKIKIVGVLIGKDRRAIAKIDGESDKTFILREGMKLGTNDAVIKAILPGGLVLVEKIRNVYEQDEYLETIIPISTE